LVLTKSNKDRKSAISPTHTRRPLRILFSLRQLRAIVRHNALKMRNSRSYIELREPCWYLVGRHDHHDVGVPSEEVDNRCKMGISHFHRLEMSLGLRAAQLKLFDNIGDAFEPLTIIELGSTINIKNQ